MKYLKKKKKGNEIQIIIIYIYNKYDDYMDK